MKREIMYCGLNATSRSALIHDYEKDSGMSILETNYFCRFECMDCNYNKNSETLVRLSVLAQPSVCSIIRWCTPNHDHLAILKNKEHDGDMGQCLSSWKI